MAAKSPPFRLLAADDQGHTWDVRGWMPSVRSGVDHRPGQTEDWIEAPTGTRLQFLDGRQPLGWPKGSRFPDPPTGLEGALAVAAQLPSGYTRTLLPSYKRTDGVPFLPFFGYTAVSFREGKPWVAAVQTDNNPHWQPQHYGGPELPKAIAEVQATFPENRVLAQLKTCSLEYGCYNAQNLYLRRWEGAVPVSPACNAQCVGCISLQPDGLPASPQERFRFVPSVQEVVELGLRHLQDDESIYSFGQGCEGEPLLQARLIADSVRALRAQTSAGTIHLNTNASKPEGFAQIVEAGLDSVRVSLNSVLEGPYTHYYQPRGYTFSDLETCIRRAREAGVLVSLNYLHMPGWNDREEEVDALIDYINRLDIQMIQMRTLNIDPDLYVQTVPFPRGLPLGIGHLVDRLSRDCPRLVIGNHTLPKHRWSRRA